MTSIAEPSGRSEGASWLRTIVLLAALLLFAWLVPVNLRFKTSDGINSRWELLDSREKTIYLGEDLEWVVVNAGGHGFYCTRYSPELAAKLTADVG